MSRIPYLLKRDGKEYKLTQEFEQKVKDSIEARNAEIRKWKPYKSKDDLYAGRSAYVCSSGVILALPFIMDEQPDGWVIHNDFRKYGFKDYSATSTDKASTDYKMIHYYRPLANNKAGKAIRSHWKTLTVMDTFKYTSELGQDPWGFAIGNRRLAINYDVIGDDIVMHVPNTARVIYKPEDAEEMALSEYREFSKCVTID